MFLRDRLNQLKFISGIAMKYPFDICLQITNRCNMKCDFCNFWSKEIPESEELSLDELRKLSKRLSRFGCFLISIEGGEPTLRPDLVDIVRAFARYHLPVLYSNGWTLTAELGKALFDAGLTQIGISIDFPDFKRHDESRGIAGSFTKAWNAVEMMRELAPNGGKQVHVMTILMRQNQDEIERMLKISERYKVGHYITLLSPHRISRENAGKYDYPATPVSEDLLQLRKNHSHLKSFYDYLARFDDFIEKKEMPECQMGKQMFNIVPTGDVTPCNEKLDWLAGNIRRDSLKSIFKKLKADTRVSQCQDCWLLCRGFSQVLGERGTFQGWYDLLTRLRST
ncbi:radical SAM protein [Candidatus Riflebacteria bacterium]